MTSYSALKSYGKITTPVVGGGWMSTSKIIKDPPKSLFTRRIDKVGDVSTAHLFNENQDRFSTAVQRYPRGVNPMTSVSYGQGQDGTQAFLPYRIAKNGAFRPPIWRQENTLPLSRLPRLAAGVKAGSTETNWTIKTIPKNFRQVQDILSHAARSNYQFSSGGEVLHSDVHLSKEPLYSNIDIPHGYSTGEEITLPNVQLMRQPICSNVHVPHNYSTGEKIFIPNVELERQPIYSNVHVPHNYSTGEKIFIPNVELERQPIYSNVNVPHGYSIGEEITIPNIQLSKQPIYSNVDIPHGYSNGEKISIPNVELERLPIYSNVNVPHGYSAGEEITVPNIQLIKQPIYSSVDIPHGYSNGEKISIPSVELFRRPIYSNVSIPHAYLNSGIYTTRPDEPTHFTRSHNLHMPMTVNKSVARYHQQTPDTPVKHTTKNIPNKQADAVAYIPRFSR